jgi:hypothetical protein
MVSVFFCPQVCAVLLKETNLSVILDNREKNELKLIVLQ